MTQGESRWISCAGDGITGRLFLTRAEVKDLTGREQPAAQKRWLQANGWVFEEDAAGRPKVARAYFFNRMARTESTAPAEGPWEVNMEAFKG
jgi:hypothetical protein